MDTLSHDRPPQYGRIMLGMLLTAAGLLMLIERLNLADVHVTPRMWPLVPMALGLLKMIDPPLRADGPGRSRRSAAWLMFIGCWGLANEFHAYGFEYRNSWPLVVVVAGINIVWAASERAACGSRAERQP